jgi:hypothetical protein
MAVSRKAKLIEIEWPEFGLGEPPTGPSIAEFETRIDAARAAMEARGLTHLIVYGDREHFANLAYLTGFDPRFEEALLILALQGEPLLVVGNECEAYLAVSPLYVAGKLRGERYQPFSLLNQPRDDSRLIHEILAGEGIGQGAQVGCAGWKYLSEDEHPGAAHALELPAYLVDTLRELAGWENVANATDILMHPGHGLRTTCSPAEIAYFEYTNMLASEGMKRMLFGLREGMTDHELAKLVEYNGVPLACHLAMGTGDTHHLGLASPRGATIRRGDPLATNLSYWGSNSCRAGWIASSAVDLPLSAKDYVDNFAAPYFEAIGEWYSLLRIGTPGAVLAHVVEERLPFERFGITLNAGHLIHLDEWLSSPIYLDSNLPLRSGMAIQVDIIPSSSVYFSTRMEDGVVLADSSLRADLQAGYPDCYARCQRRREFMIDIVGIDLPEEVLPLANIPAIVPPFFLEPNMVFALEH